MDGKNMEYIVISKVTYPNGTVRLVVSRNDPPHWHVLWQGADRAPSIQWWEPLVDFVIECTRAITQLYRYTIRGIRGGLYFKRRNSIHPVPIDSLLPLFARCCLPLLLPAPLLISIRAIRRSHHYRGLLFARLETLQYYIVEKRCLLERRSTTQR